LWIGAGGISDSIIVFGEEDFGWIIQSGWPLSEVVDRRARCIEDDNIKGGDILEVLRGKTRILPLGGPLPNGAGISGSNISHSRCGTGR
jgi:hypothetical protein